MLMMMMMIVAKSFVAERCDYWKHCGREEGSNLFHIKEILTEKYK
jgi:hypothetical protein